MLWNVCLAHYSADDWRCFRHDAEIYNRYSTHRKHHADYPAAVPQSIVYDNDRCLLATILADGTRKRTTLFSGFLSHYLIRDPMAVRARAMTRGTSKASSAMSGVTSWCRSRSLRHGRGSTVGWRSNARKRQRDRLRGESETIGERLPRDLAAMRSLPLSPFDARDHVSAKVMAQSLVRYKTNDYSVPVA